MSDEKKRKDPSGRAPGKSPTKFMERPHPENQLSKDRYEQGSNAEAAEANDRKDPNPRKPAPKKPDYPAWGNDKPDDDQEGPGFSTPEPDQT